MLSPFLAPIRETLRGQSNFCLWALTQNLDIEKHITEHQNGSHKVHPEILTNGQLSIWNVLATGTGIKMTKSLSKRTEGKHPNYAYCAL
jgi:hypothetical protein